jgi:perosamine synthetase
MSEKIRYWFDLPGFNFRMSSMQAALLVSQTKRIHEIGEKRDELFKRYDTVFEGVASRPIKEPEGYNSPWMYTILLQDISPRSLAAALASRGVETRPVFHPLDSMPAFSPFKSDKVLDVSYKIHNAGLSLPTWTAWDETDLCQLEKTIKEGIYESSVA